jgi:hypothetical protein
VLVWKGRHDGMLEHTVAAVGSALGGLLAAADDVPCVVVAEAILCLEAVWTCTEPSCAGDAVFVSATFELCLGWLHTSTPEAACVRDAASVLVQACLVRQGLLVNLEKKDIVRSLCAAVTERMIMHDTTAAQCVLDTLWMCWTDACDGLQRDVLQAALRVLHVAPIFGTSKSTLVLCSALRCMTRMLAPEHAHVGPSVAERLLFAVLRVLALCVMTDGSVFGCCRAAAERLLGMVQLPLSHRCQGVVTRFALHALS